MARTAGDGRDIDILVVGEINPDIVVSDPDPVPAFGQAERFVDGVRLTIGSSSAITACGAARLGLSVAMVGIVGDDAMGRFMLDALAERGVDVSASRVATGRRTGASVILSNGTDRAILTAVETIADVRAGDVPATLLARARHVHVGSFFLQPGLAAELPALFRAAHAAGATTSLDPNWDPSGAWDGGFAAAAAEADVLLPNAGEAVAADGERRRRGGRPLAGIPIRAGGRRSPSSAAPTARSGSARTASSRGPTRSAWRPWTRSGPATRSTPGSSRHGSRDSR